MLLITGSSGFIGTRLIEVLDKNEGIRTVSFENTTIDEINIGGIKCVIHLAGIAHRMKKTDPNIYYEVNHKKTIKLAEKAKQCGITHFIFMSTIKVFGVDSTSEKLNLNSPCNPNDPYGESKFLAELDLKKLEDRNFAASIIRTPVVYGPGVKGNIYRLIKLIDKYKYLPLGGIQNKRSMIYIDNLIAYIIEILNSRKSGIFLPSDNEVNSTSQLCESIAQELDKRSRIFRTPIFIQKLIELLFPNQYARLFGSLQVDSSQTNDKLQMVLPYTNQQGIAEMIKWYKAKVS